MTPTQAEALAYAEKMAGRLQGESARFHGVRDADMEALLAIGFMSGLIAGRKETADVFDDTVSQLNG
jgi:hypothetical protein